MFSRHPWAEQRDDPRIQKMKAMFFLLSKQSYSPYFVFVCHKAVYGSSMWHVLWGVPSRMTVKKGGDVLRCEERNVRAKDMLFVLDCFVPRNDASRGEERVQKGERMCVEGVLMAKDSFPWILGSLRGNAQG
jgi:hypothetical protein